MLDFVALEVAAITSFRPLLITDEGLRPSDSILSDFTIQYLEVKQSKSEMILSTGATRSHIGTSDDRSCAYCTMGCRCLCLTTRTLRTTHLSWTLSTVLKFIAHAKIRNIKENMNNSLWTDTTDYQNTALKAKGFIRCPLQYERHIPLMFHKCTLFSDAFTPSNEVKLPLWSNQN